MPQKQYLAQNQHVYLDKKEKRQRKYYDKIENNLPLSTSTLNDLCRILNCRLDEIAIYVPEEDKTEEDV